MGDPELIREPPPGPDHYGPPGPNCPKCKRAQLVAGAGGWFCPICGYRS